MLTVSDFRLNDHRYFLSSENSPRQRTRANTTSRDMRFNEWLPFNLLLLVSPVASTYERTLKTGVLGRRGQTRVRADPDLSMPLVIAISQQNVGEAINALLVVSNPYSPTYGKYWAASKTAEAFSASAEATNRVLQWLYQSGVPSQHVTSLGSSALHLNVTVAEAEMILSTNCYSYTGIAGGEVFLGYDTYVLDSSIAAYVDYILPSSIAWPQPERSRDQVGAIRPRSGPLLRRNSNGDCVTRTTPECLRDRYKMPLYNDSHPGNSFGIFQPAWASWRDTDLDNFFQAFHPELDGQRPLMMEINGGYRRLDADVDAFNLEPNLDFQYAMSLSYPLPVTNIQVGSEDAPGNLNTMLAAFDKSYCPSIDPDRDALSDSESFDCGTVVAPKVISISYVWNEADFPPEYLERQCLEFLKLGLQGVTVVVSGGDSGPAKHPDGTCLGTATDTQSGEDGRGAFSPAWPASCPWVTVVGGTQLSVVNEGAVAWRNQPSTGSPPSLVTEVTYSRVVNKVKRSSGGGFSTRFPSPEYQRGTAARYMGLEREHLESFQHQFNSSGRGYPDVSILASAYQIMTGGKQKSVYGTSASAPVFGSMIARINDARLKAGKSSVGFINPVVYANPEIFNDIVLGSNSGCGVNEAFRAVEGWDAATGLGSPDYQKLLDVFMGLD